MSCGICYIDNNSQLTNSSDVFKCNCKGIQYHLSCISNWIQTHNTCPTCRKQITFVNYMKYFSDKNVEIKPINQSRYDLYLATLDDHNNMSVSTL